MPNLSNLSFHPKLAAVLDLAVNLVLIWWLKQISAWWAVGLWVAFRIAIWALLIKLVYYPQELRRWKHFAALVFLSLGALSFLLFVEWSVAWYLIAAIYSGFAFLSFWILPTSHVSITPFLKPHLRWRFIMSVVGLAGIFQGVGAVTSFQILDNVSVWVWIISASALSTLIAGWWWFEYKTELSKKYWVWIFAWFGLVVELLWVVELLPLGYLASSLLLVWVWYILWLLARFNLTPEGIDWKKQSFFLGTNAVLILLFLFFVVRWK